MFLDLFRRPFPRFWISRKFFSIPDLLIVFIFATLIYALLVFSQQWSGGFRPETPISLEFWALPGYVLQSALRGMTAYVLSLTFTLLVGYWAAKSVSAEKFILPLLDIMQSIPVLGFLPGVVLALLALFPNSNLGLELACILMIFSGQVWNMVFDYYASLKSIPVELEESAQMLGLSAWQKWLKLELPFSLGGLAWNSLLSMSGGWFFLTICESFVLGSQSFRLPGIGSYMALAIAEGSVPAMFAGVLAMAGLIVALDFLVWRPVLAWVNQYRMDPFLADSASLPLMSLWIRESRILRLIRFLIRQNRFRRRILPKPDKRKPKLLPVKAMNAVYPLVRKAGQIFSFLLTIAIFLMAGFGMFKLAGELFLVSSGEWGMLMAHALMTLMRVFVAVLLSTMVMLPLGVWVGLSSERIRKAQPLIQILSSFPAPMLFPLLLAIAFYFGIPFDWASILLLQMGVQWYVLFNVLSGTLRIPADLKEVLIHLGMSKRQEWLKIYFPSVFPSLVTGWMTAAGGAWNASIVTEYMLYKNKIFTTPGLGSTISLAAENKDFRILAASLSLMVLMLIVLNRSLWAKLYQLAHSRFRMD